MKRVINMVDKGKSTKNLEQLELLESRIGYFFKDKDLLLQSMTHRSYVTKESIVKVIHNEPLEFLGDAILSFVTSDMLFKREPRLREGAMTQLRAAYVCELNLAIFAEKIKLGAALRVGNSVIAGGGRCTSSMLADALEALIGAVYMDSGLDAAKELILKVLGPLPNSVKQAAKDEKTLLQELIQKSCSVTPRYEVTSNSGPEHEPCFWVDVKVEAVSLGNGKGKNKKEAAQNCAQKVYEEIKILSDKELRALCLFADLSS